MSDKTLICKDCGAEFLFTESEQAFYREKGFQNEPQRCPSCRAANKDRRRDGGRGNYGSSPRKMYKAKCANCGKETEVPFMPSPDRPVYCKDCYQPKERRRDRY